MKNTHKVQTPVKQWFSFLLFGFVPGFIRTFSEIEGILIC